jgi:glucose-1-phosphate cytidylyltransferase
VRVRPSQTFHTVSCDDAGYVKSLSHVTDTDVWINGGFFVMRPEVFDYMRPGEELVERPFDRMAAERQLVAYRHDGFWAAMDTFRDKAMFDTMHDRNERPWEVWNASAGGGGHPPWDAVTQRSR